MSDLKSLAFKYLPLGILFIQILGIIVVAQATRPILIIVLFGQLLGWTRAHRKNGILLDKYHWAAVHGVVFGMFGILWFIISSSFLA